MNYIGIAQPIRYTWFVLLCIICQTGCKIPPNKPLAVAFYNVENLFDTLDDPSRLDDDFTPGGKQGWTEERYQTKLTHLSRVFDAMGSPELIGVAEIENEQVLQDLQKKINTPVSNYGIAHFDSPDPRGIDVALLFHEERFQLISKKAILISGIFDSAPLVTRDILYVRLRPKKGGDLHVFVNHWPSRSGGVRPSAPKRQAAAITLRDQIIELERTEPKPNIIIMGDFNDTPKDSSIQDVLLSIPSLSGGFLLTNPFTAFMLDHKGSYNYRGSWDMIDQIILSKNMIEPRNRPRFQQAGIFQQEWMMYDDYKYGLSPSRTYGGPKYYGGYSDHLPVFITLK